MSANDYNTRIGYSKGILTPFYWAVTVFEQLMLAVFKRSATFRFEGEDIPYVRSTYNRTWATERCVEIAIARRELAANQGKRVLEVGNVLYHYGDRGHVVVDKYERGEGVRNIDIVELGSEERYDLILTISTMEHVGWDETPREPEKFMVAYNRLLDALAPGGKLVVLVPVDWSEWLDAQLAADSIPADRITWFERTKYYLSWRECEKDAALAKQYGKPYPNANGLVLLETVRAD